MKFFNQNKSFFKKISIKNLKFKNIIYTFFFILFFTTFLYAPVSVTSAAMEPALLEGDYMVVSKYSYGYGKYSFPFIKLPINGRIFKKLPKRGDIIAFKTPEGEFGIQRVIGLPSDKIQMKRSVLFINNLSVHREFIGLHTHVCKFHNKLGLHGATVDRFLEFLSNGKVFETLDTTYDNIVDNTNVYIVPKGYYFVMGDNRDESLDSRFKNIGFIPLDHIIGESKTILFSLNEHTWKFWKWPVSVRWIRFFKKVK